MLFVRMCLCGKNTLPGGFCVSCQLSLDVMPYTPDELEFFNAKKERKSSAFAENDPPDNS